MSDLTSPLKWNLELTPQASHEPWTVTAPVTVTPPAPAPAPAPAEKGRHVGFRWPTPPFAAYPDALEQNQPQACRIVGLNDREMAGRLIFFVPEQKVAHVQVPPARTTMPLKFSQFRSLRVSEPLKPASDGSHDPHAGMLEHRPSSRYKVTLKSGPVLEGDTIGHVETPHGLFLFPPLDDAGSVQRLFVPRDAYASFEIGERIGELLVAQKAATPQQVAAAADMQQQLRNQKLGDILVSRQVVTPEQLLSAIDQQAKMPMVRIGEALTSLGLVTDDQLKGALDQQKNDRSVPLGELLVRMGTVSREDLQTALARKMGYPVVNVDKFPVETEALRKLPYAAAARLHVLPLLIREGRLVIAIDDPARRRAAVDEVEFVSQMKVVPVLALGRAVADTIFEVYEKIGAATMQAAPNEQPDRPIEFVAADTGRLMETLEKEHDDQPAGEDERQIEQSDNSLVRLINNMIIEAHKEGVSDIHIESYPGRDKIKVRFRKDGLLRTHLELPPSYRNALIARIKIMCDLDISERRKPQDGKINFAKFSPQHKIELRVATIPTNGGLEDVVMRILASAKPIPLDNLGLSPWNLAHLKEAMERPYGLVLCVGPTGSGKTTTLHSALSHINVPERKIWTAEDPVEITQPGLRQVQVNPKIDWTFAKALRAFLRADPDVIMVGEMRDGETAQMGVEASLTGHLVLSTLHTNSAPRDRDAADRHGPGPLQLRRLAAGRAGPAPGAPPVQPLPHVAPGHRGRGERAARRLPARVSRRPSGLRPRRDPPGVGPALRPGRPTDEPPLPRLRAVRPHRPAWPRRAARADDRLARAAPADPDQRPRRGAAADRAARRHAHAAPGRHREGAAGRDQPVRSARDQQRLTLRFPEPEPTP